jgi:hypothetical protein
MRVPSRRTFWLSAALLLAVVVGVAWVLVPRSRITQKNFDRIQEGMSKAEVYAILGHIEFNFVWHDISLGGERHAWKAGPNAIVVFFDEDKVCKKVARFATTWETLKWYATKGAEKVGVQSAAPPSPRRRLPAAP